jgi:hypothetical protein
MIFIVLGWVSLQYAGNMKAIVERGGSTNGHIERMKMGIKRFIAHPLGQWLASAWPGYRYVQKLENTDRKSIEEIDRYYIPESWYIQQMIEWGIFWCIMFLSSILLILFGIFRVHIVLAGMFVGICIMNLFLHTFESSIVSLSLFLLLWLFIAYKKNHDMK